MSEDKIRSIGTFAINPRFVLVMIKTEQGLTGFGDCTLEGQPNSVAGAVEDIKQMFIGKDPDNIRALVKGAACQLFYRTGTTLSALAGIDIALWDIKGKREGKPIHALLGGAVKHRLLAYRWGADNSPQPEKSAGDAQGVLDQGWKAMKMNACLPLGAVDTAAEGLIAHAVACAEAVRDQVGDKIDLAFDFHGRVSPVMAGRLIEALKPFNPLFFEEVVRPEYNSALPTLAAIAGGIPLATGERMFTPNDFAELQGATIYQPDCVHVGGITFLSDIAAIAESRHHAIAPHCPLSPLAFMACMHTMLTINASFILECARGIHYNQHGASGDQDLWDIWVNNREVFNLDSDGYMAAPIGPGLGLEIDEDMIREMAKDGTTWRDPAMTGPSGERRNW